ncbi:MAG: hypothetical protein F4X44_12025 [Gammaproteobacteria bacterium]|nr:hypothetical protein [Gammaproteobacteria bacterium]MYD81325.1 hypothetical protein [Gammaproteobacteria bacterium]
MQNPRLTPNQIYEFLDLGYLKIQLQHGVLGKDFAARMFERAREAYSRADLESHHQNRIAHIADEGVDSLPEVKQLHSSPEINGALTSLLGHDFYRYRHSFIHRADQFDQSFHKDSPLPWGTKGGIRSHKLEWTMAFYYPQDTTLALGPTEILPGSQYWNVDRLGSGNTYGEDRLGLDFERENVGSSPDLELRDKHLETQRQSLDEYIEPLRLEVNANSLVLVHFDLFHRGTRMTCGGERYMFKFWYTRTSEPEPASEQTSASYQPKDSRRQPIVKEIGSWMNLPISKSRGERGSDTSPDCLQDASEANRLCGGYLKARRQDESLIDEACSGIESTRRSAVYALAARPSLAKKAIPRLLNSDSFLDQQCAMFLIGECCDIGHSMVANAVDMTRNEEADASRAAIIALGKIKRRQQHPISEDSHNQIVESLFEVLKDSNKDGAHRQLVYLSLLSFAADSHNTLELDQVVGIEEAVSAETNKYARSTGVEVLARAARVTLNASP